MGSAAAELFPIHASHPHPNLPLEGEGTAGRIAQLRRESQKIMTHAVLPLATARRASFARPPCCLVGSPAPTFYQFTRDERGPPFSKRFNFFLCTDNPAAPMQ
jgi:hypothetical protein